MTDLCEWPDVFGVPRRIVFHPSSRSRSGGSGLDGMEQPISHPFGIWTATAEGIWLRDRAGEFARRGLLVDLGGRAGHLRVPVFDCAFGPGLVAWPSPVPAGGVPHDDEAPHDDDAGYDFRPIVEGAAAATYPRQATTITIAIHAVWAVRILRGHYFSVGALVDRLHLVRKVVPVSGGVRMEFWPPLRSQLVAGAAVVFDYRVCCRMRLADDGQLRGALDNGISTDLTLSLIEAFD